jgi:hypothetical protein
LCLLNSRRFNSESNHGAAPGAPLHTWSARWTESYTTAVDVRRNVLADKHIARRQQSLDRFTQQQNELVTQLAWGKI